MVSRLSFLQSNRHARKQAQAAKKRRFIVLLLSAHIELTRIENPPMISYKCPTK
ncbi:MAG: hypothetical protein N3B01_05305 [Verrucomicrobiae bacterium]|nr:hypothetical protein [Verrucomicrobiae bacterium]